MLGTWDNLDVDLRGALKIAGRIPPKTVWDYLEQMREVREINTFIRPDIDLATCSFSFLNSDNQQKAAIF